ncbi:MAG: bifunctional riboflavin kinase/FAD synthetase [bacterium]
MLIFHEIKTGLVDSSCLALGMFDGMHLGHQKVIKNAVEKSKKLAIPSIIVTFSKHPQYITTKAPVKLITSLESRLDLFEKAGIDIAVVLNFTEELSKMSAGDYLKTVLTEGLNAKSITIGYNHHFGSQKKGNSKFFEQYSSQYGYEINVISPVTLNNQIISSSAIRNLISTGDVSLCLNLLGRPFSIKGAVIIGKQRGAGLGFPTANLSMSDDLIIPGDGVYLGLANIGKNQYNAVINIGRRPTFNDLKTSLTEVHILDFNENIYNKEIEVSFLKKLRNEKKFSSENELKKQIKLDCQEAMTYTLSS